MINKIKDKLFEVLSSNYENQIVDNAAAVEEGEYPRIQIRLSTVTRLNIESEIFDMLEQFYEIDGVTYVRESGFRILDDKSTGVIRKHGIISLTFYCTGEEVTA